MMRWDWIWPMVSERHADHDQKRGAAEEKRAHSSSSADNPADTAIAATKSAPPSVIFSRIALDVLGGRFARPDARE